MKNSKRYVGLLLSALLLLTQITVPVFAADEMNVIAANVFASEQKYDLAPGGNVWASAGKIYFTLDDAVDPATLDGNVSLTAGGENIPCGADLYRSNNIIGVSFGKLTPGTAYNLHLGSGIKSADGSRSLKDYAIPFTAGKDSIYSQDFSGFTTDMDTNAIKEKLLEDSAMTFPVKGSENVTLAVVPGESGNALRIKSGTDTTANAGRIDGVVTVPDDQPNKGNKGAYTGLVYDAILTMEAYGTQINVGKFTGARGANMLRVTNDGTNNMKVIGDFSSGASTPKNPDFITKVDKTKPYHIRIVYRIAETLDMNGTAGSKNMGFLIDTYLDKEDGKGYQPVNKNILTSVAGVNPQPTQNITGVSLFSINGWPNDTQVSQAVFHDIKVYRYLPVQIMKANVKNMGTVPADLQELNLVFNADMKADTLNGTVSLYNVTDDTTTSLTGNYDAANRTFKASVAGMLEAGKEYSVQIGDAISADGFRFDEECKLTFRAESADPKVTVTGTTVNGIPADSGVTGVSLTDTAFAFTFDDAIDTATVAGNVTFQSAAGANVGFTTDTTDDKVLIVKPASLSGKTGYQVTLGEGIRSKDGSKQLMAYTFGFSTEASATNITVEKCSVAEGAANVRPAVGQITFTLDETADPNSLKDNITFRTKTGNPVAFTAAPGANGKNIQLTFDRLELNTDYTVTLTSGITNAAGNKALVEYALHFRTIQRELYAGADFEDETIFPTGQPLQDGNWDFYHDFKPDGGSNPTGKMTVMEENGNKYLHVDTGVGTGRETVYFDFPGGKITESFVYDGSVRFLKTDTNINMGQPGWANAFMTMKNTSNFWAYHYPDPALTKMEQKNLIPTITKGKWYKVRIVYNKLNDEGKYLLDAYLDSGNGNGYQLMGENIRLAQNIANQVNTLKLFSINDPSNAADNASVDFDDLMLYPYDPPRIADSSIPNLASGVNTDTNEMILTFSRDMRKSFSVKLKNRKTQEEKVLNYSYIEGSRELKIEIPTGSLSKNNEYEVVVGNAFSADGFKLEGQKSIAFTTSESFSDVELDAPIQFTDKSGEPLKSIYGQTSVYAKVPLRKMVDGDVEAQAFIALYDENNILQQCKVFPQTITEDTVLEGIGLESTEPFGYKWTAKVFLWKGSDSMIPLIPNGEIASDVDLKLPTLFTDGMVLQRDMPVRVWGEGYDGEDVTVTLNGQTKTVRPSGGRWSLELDRMSAGGPYTMTVTNGENRKEFTNVMVGDVWLVSGQSNIVKQMNEYTSETQADIDSANYPNIRFYKIADTPTTIKQDDIPKSSWSVCNGTTARTFSCVGFYFGREIYQSLEENVPVGLIQSAVGGTRIERWMSAEAIKKYSVTGIEAQTGETELYNGMIAPLQNYGIKGVLWYQGESNHSNAGYYENDLHALINSWREEWSIGDFPFIYVQIAAFEQYNFAPIWQAQKDILNRERNVAMVSAVELEDLQDIHPPYKKKVGERAALAARKLAYGENIEFMGPIVDTVTRSDDTITVTFTHADGLKSMNWKENNKEVPLTGFQVGDGTALVDATAAIAADGKSVTLTWSGVANPTEVRYCYTSRGGVTLYNSSDLPASPFKETLK